MTDFVEKSEVLSSEELATLISESAYILDLTLVDKVESDNVSFEGGDDWIFDQYTIVLNEQLFPDNLDGCWTSRTLSLPGRKADSGLPSNLPPGERYLAFYSYSAMARGYSLEGLMSCSEDRLTRINTLISA